MSEISCPPYFNNILTSSFTSFSSALKSYAAHSASTRCPRRRTRRAPSVTAGAVAGNCYALEGSESAPKLSACSRCRLVAYCSRNCQRDHWKTNHKQYCISKAADRAPQLQKPPEAFKGAEYGASNTSKACAICQDQMTNETSCALSCGHAFHVKCIAQMRKFGVKQGCFVPNSTSFGTRKSL